MNPLVFAALLSLPEADLEVHFEWRGRLPTHSQSIEWTSVPVFRPADGVDEYIGGKLGDYSPEEELPSAYQMVMRATESHAEGDTLVFEGGDTLIGYSWPERGCVCRYEAPPEDTTPSPVPLPASGWYLLAGLLGLTKWRKRNDT